MTKKHQHFSETIAILILLCGVFIAGIGAFFPQEAISLPTDAGVGLDAGNAENTVTIVIDAGHGGEDSGTQSADGLYEKDVNLEIAQLLDTMLRANGISTVMTRSEDILLYDRNADYRGHKKMLDLATRRKIAEETENAVFVSIHMNAFPESKYRGLQVFYSPNHPQAMTLASVIQHDAQSYLQPDNNRKIKSSTSAIYLLDRLECPAVLIECGFLSNPDEAALFATDQYRKEVAFVIFSSLISYISGLDA